MATTCGLFSANQEYYGFSGRLGVNNGLPYRPVQIGSGGRGRTCWSVLNEGRSSPLSRYTDIT